MGDKERMKKAFQKLILIQPPQVEQNYDFEPNSKDDPIEDFEVFDQDHLRAVAREKKAKAQHYILFAAKLVAPNIEETSSQGYDWIVETLKSSYNADMASELEIAKSIQFLRSKEFDQAVECLKQFERKDPKLVGTAATNLSFLYFLEGEYRLAEQYADVAIEHDRYNSKAQTNRGNVFFIKENFKKAKEHYQEAISVDSSCTEAMYNIGLVNKRLQYYTEALMWFEKLHAILRSNAEVIFQIADIYDKQGNIESALEWYNILISVVPTDPSILCRLGEIFDQDGDKSQAFQYFSESYRYHPSNMNVISWLGAYYVECEVYEQAIQFFERAVIIQPSEVKWRLMIASCYRRCGNYQQAYETYKDIHEKFPEEVECLKYLVRICTELGLREAADYSVKLARAEKLNRNESASRRNSTNEQSIQMNFDQEKVSTIVSSNQPKPVPRQEDVRFDEDVSGLLPE